MDKVHVVQVLGVAAGACSLGAVGGGRGGDRDRERQLI